MNDNLIHRTGYQATGELCYQVLHEREQVCPWCVHDRVWEGETVRWQVHSPKDRRWYDAVSTPILHADGSVSTQVVLFDITAHKSFEAEQMRATQLASIGELAAGVAHEINNPINSIINFAQVLKEGGMPPEVVSEIFELMISEGQRIASIVGKLLDFSRKDRQGPSPIPIAHLVKHALDLAQVQMEKDGIWIDVDVPDDLPLVGVQKQEMQQVFINLLSNARYALNSKYEGQHPGKRISISAGERVLPQRRMVWISFHDTGPGIPPHVLPRIYEPFYTTKPSGVGTGLGLSISDRIVREHSGSLSVHSDGEHFTKVVVQLPVWTAESSKPEGPSK